MIREFVGGDIAATLAKSPRAGVLILRETRFEVEISDPPPVIDARRVSSGGMSSVARNVYWAVVDATPLSRTAGETSSASASRTSVVTRGSRSPRSIRETSVTWIPERWLTSSCVRLRRFLARETFCAKTSRGGTLVMVL